MRYCVDCEHYEAWVPKPICGRFKKEFMVSEHPVHGPKMSFSAPECETARAEGGQCGPNGRFFIAQPGTRAWVEAQEQAREEAERRAQDARPWWRRLAKYVSTVQHGEKP